jgi:hypothetical protein
VGGEKARKKIRTGTGQPSITRENLRCYHAGSIVSTGVGCGWCLMTVLLGLGQIACLERLVCDFLGDGNEEISADCFEMFMEGGF